jgi:hypothetical protein
MNTHFAHQQLAETCRSIGAIFTYEEAEGEARACIIKGHHWWSLILSTDGDDNLWLSQLQQLRHHH